MIQKRDLWVEAQLDELTAGETRMDFMLRFTLSHRDIDTIIVGTVNPVHLDANVQAAASDGLPVDVYQEALRRLKAI